MDGVLEVVADVCDAVGPAHDLAFGGRRCRPCPGVVADAVGGLRAQVQRGEGDVGAPLGVVIATVHIRAEGVLAGVSAGPVSTVVPERDGLGERHVQAEPGGDGPGHLGHLEGVGEPGALVVFREDEHLGLAGQSPERRAVQDAVPVPLEAGAERVGRFDEEPVSCTGLRRGRWVGDRNSTRLALLPSDYLTGLDGRRTVGVCGANRG